LTVDELSVNGDDEDVSVLTDCTEVLCCTVAGVMPLGRESCCL
jgi:hypothetical protein